MNAATMFLHQVEADPNLRVRMEAADGDMDEILTIARDAGHAVTKEQYLSACQELMGQPATGVGPEVYFAHPEVYFAHPEVYFAHPEVYFAHPEVYFAHPEVYFHKQPTSAPAAR